MGAFNDMLQTQRMGNATIDQVRSFMAEVNQTLGEDKSAKHSFAMQLAKHPWFAANGQEVRYKPSQNFIDISQSMTLAATKKR